MAQGVPSRTLTEKMLKSGSQLQECCFYNEPLPKDPYELYVCPEAVLGMLQILHKGWLLGSENMLKTAGLFCRLVLSLDK